MFIKKAIAAVVCVSLCLIGSAQPVFAAETEAYDAVQIGIQPQWINVSNITISMSYSGSSVSWGGQVWGNSNTASIKATYKLEKKNSDGSYSTVTTWANLSTVSDLLISSGSASAAKGIYKLTVTAVVTSTSGVSETVSDSLEKTFS